MLETHDCIIPPVFSLIMDTFVPRLILKADYVFSSLTDPQMKRNFVPERITHRILFTSDLDDEIWVLDLTSK